MQEERIQGIVERIVYKSEDNGYHVLSVDTFENQKKFIFDKEDFVCVTVVQPRIYEGCSMEFYGEWQHHPKFGKQFRASKCCEISPATREGLKRYLSSSFFPGVGPVIAEKIIKHFGDDAMLIFNKDINRITEVSGVATKKLEKIKERWVENKEINDIMVFLQAHGISTLYAAKIYELYGTDCVFKIRKNPYDLSKKIKGIGFKYADKVALSLGFKKNDKERVEAAIRYILDQKEGDGHCFLYLEQIKQELNKIIGEDADELLNYYIHIFVTSGEIKTREFEEGKIRYYSSRLYTNEEICANKIKILSSKKYKANSLHISQWQKTIDSSSFKLSEEQHDSIIKAVESGVSILTGGPGCGKTTTLNFLLKLLDTMEVEYLLGAPTGRASKRMSEVTGKQSKTIHRLLEWNGLKKGFLRDEMNQLECNFLVIDECSMIDINLASSLLKAVSPDTRVLFIGDYNQLPPIGAGIFFRDMIESGLLNVFVLNKIFRQGKGSSIITYAHQINNDIIPKIENPINNPRMWTDKEDCMFMDSDNFDDAVQKNEYETWNTLRYGMDVIATIKRLFTETIPKNYKIDSSEIQIITPMNKGDLGTTKINEEIQKLVNPPAEHKKEIKLGSHIFREGDKVIQMVNNYDLDAINGDIGIIKTINLEENECIIDFPDGKVISYKKQNLLEIKLAYAITCHKSQGSEFEVVIIPIMTQHYIMLKKNLIYTALTRAKKLAVFVGQRRALAMAVKTSDVSQRQTSLKELLKK